MIDSRLMLCVLLFSLVGCKDADTHYQGYVDADHTYVSAPVAGRLASLEVQRGDTVREGQPLFSCPIITPFFDIKKTGRVLFD